VTRLATEEKVPWVSANVRPAGGKPAYPSTRLIPWGEKKIGVFGLAPPSPRADPGLGVIVEDPVESARRAVQELSQADLIVCLSGLGLTADKALAAAVPRIAVIVGSGEGPRLFDPPQRVGDTLILRCADRGRQVGLLDLDAAAVGPNWKTPVPEGDEAAIRSQIDQFSARLNPQPGRRTLDPAERSRIERSISALRGTLEELERSPVRIRHRLIPLSNEVHDDAAVKAAVDNVLSHRPAVRPPPAQVAGRTPFDFSSSSPERLEIPPGAGRVVAPPPKPPEGDPAYVGTLPCRRCHRAEYQGWLSTGHARSMSSLPPEKRLDPVCRACHAFQFDSGEESMVGCEACHGKGSHHTGPGNILRAVPEATCRACHRGHHPEENFDYRRDYERIRCDVIRKK
jgi:hypothetical protein